MKNIVLITILVIVASIRLTAQDSTKADISRADTATIAAARPNVDRHPAHVVHVIDQDFLRTLPSRGINTPIVILPGVLTEGYPGIANPVLFGRGGHDGEYEERLEDAPISGFFTRSRSVTITAEAVEQINVHAGGDAAEFGGSNDGVIMTRLRTGAPDQWRLMLMAETDRYAPMDKGGLGGYSYGYSDWTATAGGPAPILGNTLLLFGSVQNTFYRDPAVSARSGFNFSGANALITQPIYSQYHPNALLPDTLNFVLPGGNTPGGLDNRWVLTGTALLDISPVELRIAGSYSMDRSRTPSDLANLLNQSRLPLNIDRNGFISLKLSHQVVPAFRYDVGLSYAARSYVTEDPQFLDTVFAYGDPAANQALGYSAYSHSWENSNWPAFNLWDGVFTINEPGTQIAGFAKSREECLSARGAFTVSAKSHEVKGGFEYNQYTVRMFDPPDPGSWYYFRRVDTAPGVLPHQLAVQQAYSGFGYDVFGNEISSDDVRDGYMYTLGPRRPYSWAAFVQDRMQSSHFTLSLGLRYDVVSPDVRQFPDLYALYESIVGLFTQAQFTTAGPISQLSPRIGAAYAFGDAFSVHAQFGRFMHRDEMLTGESPTLIRTTQWEAGVSWQVTDNLFVDLTGFLKYIENQQTEIAIIAGNSLVPNQYSQIGDYSDTRGVDLSILLARTGRLSARAGYTLQDPGTYRPSQGGIPLALIPSYPGPYPMYVDEFRERHRGSAQIDYRFGEDDGGPVLERTGLNLLLTFNSGHSYSTYSNFWAVPVDPRFRYPVGSPEEVRTHWFWQVDGRVDKSLRLGPVDVDFYVYVINLLGTDNPVNVFPYSGDPGNDGWLSTAGGASTASYYGPQYAAFYNAVVNGKNSGNWGPPRQIRFGARLEY